MYALTDTAELAAELSAVDGVPLTDALGMAAAHLQRLTHGAGAGTVCVNCGKYGHAAIDCPEPRQPLPGGRTLYVVAADPPAPEPAPEPNPQPPYGPQRPFPAQVNLSDRPRCTYCGGPHTDAECPLRRPVFVAVSAPAPEPSDRPVTLYCESLEAEIVDWRGGYVLRGRGEDDYVTVSFGDQIFHLTLEQARQLRALIALPQVRRLLVS